ncbi:NADPH-dependent F420 reductase [Paenibacillus cremeus]|uniref:Reductase n=1 Tax=Paenibacillus cremeus TaxID=2163881 RepID=A0A559K372_9BACL|nr:NAD(P)-binding domain-containing protein [Paenibacillus cremeus]TVY06556.1 reductase [Paenibacillus cremeus]
MKTTVIGTGRMGQGLMKVLYGHIPNLQWASRSKDRVEALILENGYTNTALVDYESALDSEILIHTLWYRDLIPWAWKNRDRLTGKILVDIANPFTEDFKDFTTEWGSSAAEELQAVLPETKVVGAFKNTFFKVFDLPVHQGLQSDVYVTGDDLDAKEKVISMLSGIPFRVLDGGSLQNNRTIERMTLFEREVAIRYGHYPYVSFRLFGL